MGKYNWTYVYSPFKYTTLPTHVLQPLGQKITRRRQLADPGTKLTFVVSYMPAWPSELMGCSFLTSLLYTTLWFFCQPPSQGAPQIVPRRTRTEPTGMTHVLFVAGLEVVVPIYGVEISRLGWVTLFAPCSHASINRATRTTSTGTSITIPPNISNHNGVGCISESAG